MKQKNFLFYLPLCIGIVFSSCSKNDTGPEVLTDPERAELGNLSAEAFLTANKLVVEGLTIINNGQKGFSLISENPEPSGELPENFFAEIFPSTETGANCYAVYSTQEEDNAYTVTLDFGSGCMGIDANTRAGKIIYTQRFSDLNGTFNVKLEYRDYQLNEFKINGIVEKSASIQDQVLYSTGSYQIAGPSGSRSIIDLNHQFEEENGVILLTGNMNGRFAKAGKNIAWTAEISKPVALNFDCIFPVAGVVNFTQSGHSVATLDYGSGSCDREALLTVNAEGRIISLY